MKYLGSKRRIIREIAPIILQGRGPGQYVVEPFCGGLNASWCFPPPHIAADVSPYLIALLRAVQQGWQPPTEVSEALYKSVMSAKHMWPPELVGFVGFCCSFGGDFGGGYARGGGRDYAAEACRGFERDAPKMQGREFVCSDYTRLSIPDRAIIYCDPPYSGAKGYGHKFDNEAFWRWAAEKVQEGHQVYVSEYSAPSPWRCIWSKELPCQVDSRRPVGSRVEKLYTLEGKVGAIIER